MFNNEQDYWNTVRQVLEETEFGLLDSVGKKVVDLFANSKFKNPNQMMTPDEEMELNHMEDEIVIYRGIGTDEKIDFKKYGYGLHWTTNKDIAMWFARGRGGHFKALLTATISRDKVVAYFNQKGEQEVLINPSDLNVNIIINKWSEK